MVRENPTWGEERVAGELSVKLGILVSPRTVRSYWPRNADPRGRRKTSSQHWRCFVWNHAKAMVATDFLLAMTASFRVLYVLVVMEIGSRRILHCNVTAHPTAAWVLQQFREAVRSDHSYRFLTSSERIRAVTNCRNPDAIRHSPTCHDGARTFPWRARKALFAYPPFPFQA